MKIQQTSLTCTPQPIHPLGFKGGYLNELWQVSVCMETDTGLHAAGLGVESVLWSDSAVFLAFGPDKSNQLMLDTTRYAIDILKGETLVRPDLLIRAIFGETLAYAKKITGTENLRTTFVLNALTPVDWALWKLWRQASGNPCFSDLTRPVTQSLRPRQKAVSNIPLLSYATPEQQIRELADEGRALFKIKIGSNPGERNDLEEMVQWDISRLDRIHGILSAYETTDTKCGHPAYYLDANGRYDTPDRLMRLMEAADRMGALDRILLLEEPFPENALCSAAGIPVPVAGDESAHSARDAVMLMEEYDYSAIALKPIAKTLSVSLEVLEEAQKRKVPCFCADLTVNPGMVEMNKLFAAHLPEIPGMNVGVFESNGSQNYLNWNRMMEQYGLSNRPFSQMKHGKFTLDEAYYRCEGDVWRVTK